MTPISTTLYSLVQGDNMLPRKSGDVTLTVASGFRVYVPVVLKSYAGGW